MLLLVHIFSAKCSKFHVHYPLIICHILNSILNKTFVAILSVVSCYVFVSSDNPDPRLLGPTTGQLRLTETPEKTKEEQKPGEK